MMNTTDLRGEIDDAKHDRGDTQALRHTVHVAAWVVFQDMALITDCA